MIIIIFLCLAFDPLFYKRSFFVQLKDDPPLRSANDTVKPEDPLRLVLL